MIIPTDRMIPVNIYFTRLLSGNKDYVKLLSKFLHSQLTAVTLLFIPCHRDVMSWVSGRAFKFHSLIMASPTPTATRPINVKVTENHITTNSLQNNEMSDSTNLKAFADDEVNVKQIKYLFFERVANIV